MYFIIAPAGFSQNKKILGHEELVTWNEIKAKTISNYGNFVAFEVKPEEGDGYCLLWKKSDGESIIFERGHKPVFTDNEGYLIFTILPPEDTIRAQKLRKLDSKEHTKDTLAIFNLSSLTLQSKLPNVKSYKVLNGMSDWIVYHLHPDTADSSDSLKLNDNAETGSDSTALTKKENDKNGSKLKFLHISENISIDIPFVKTFSVAEDSPVAAIYSTGKDTSTSSNLLYFNADEQSLITFYKTEHEVSHLDLSDGGQQVAWIINSDTSDDQSIKYNKLMYFNLGKDTATTILDSFELDSLTFGYASSKYNFQFCDSLSILEFGIQQSAPEKDSLLLDDEIAKVEVWHYKDNRLHTQQKAQLDSDLSKAYTARYFADENKIIVLNTPKIPEIVKSDELDHKFAIIYDDAPYLKSISWDGFPSAKDVYRVDTRTGEVVPLRDNVVGSISLSPGGKYCYWYEKPDSVWYAIHLESGELSQLTSNDEVAFYQEIFDMPDHPYPYGVMGWSEDDNMVYIYDRFDIWAVNPKVNLKSKVLTQGRSRNLRYRFINLNREEQFVDTAAQWLLHVFNDQDMSSGYALYNYTNNDIKHQKIGEYYYSRSVTKADSSDFLLYTKESFIEFPNLILSDTRLSSSRVISDVNPQQKNYKWGSVDLIEWTSLDGHTIKGKLYKPEGFNKDYQYPMIVNFYEKSSESLYRHRPPSAGRSTINYPFYTSRGYLIFVPDVHYRDGYPGESAFNCVIPGVTHLIDSGFVNPDKIALQGHSWGGYQIAYLLTRTNMFACAESGAPVVNMISAYGGIRWETGLSRMFQYEKTQSRIGGTLWEYPLRYIENSPLFTMDKVETPVLIMHNDGDGHVPWYQGIEYFVALRRLNKPAWLLNYNDEPHWPLKLANRKDFNIRMQQFFDHYLQNAEKPEWMDIGVSARDKGINQRLNLMEE